MQKKSGTYFKDEYYLFKNIKCKDDLIKFQYLYLTKLLVYAGEKVPYYQNLLKNFDIISDGIVNIANFQNIPLMTKEIAQKYYEETYKK